MLPCFKKTGLLPALLIFGCLTTLQPGIATASIVTYQVNFDSSNGNDGSGSFIWDSTARKMTSFSWSFAGGTDSFSDSALAKKIWSPGSARTTGELLFNLFTDPLAYWPSTNGLLAYSGGEFTTNFFSWGAISGTYPADMIVFGYTKGNTSATYEILDLSPGRTVLDSGSISAVAVSEPGSIALSALGLTALVGLKRRRIASHPA